MTKYRDATSTKAAQQQAVAKEKVVGAMSDLDGVCFDCSGRSSGNNYSEGMRKVADYFGCTYKNGTDIQAKILKERVYQVQAPVNPTVGDDAFRKAAMAKLVAEWVSRGATLQSNMGQVYNVMFVQCNEYTRTELEAFENWEEISDNADLLRVLKALKGLIFKHDETEYYYTSMRHAIRNFLNQRQYKHTVTKYYRNWRAGKELAEEFGYMVGESKTAMDRECSLAGIS